jgi:non-ribosomal peptide synthetase component F
VHRELDPALSQSLREFAKARNTGMYALLLAGFQTLMSRLSSQEDIVVGIPAAGQAGLDVNTIGYCVNALPIRSATRHDKPFDLLMHETQRSVLDAFEHQETLLSELVRDLRVPRDPSRLPLIEAIFNYSRYFADLNLAGCTVKTRENRRQAIYYDLFFNIVEADGRLIVDWDYNSELFDEETIERWIDHLAELLNGVVQDSSRAIGDLPLLSAEQGAAVAASWGTAKNKGVKSVS